MSLVTFIVPLPASFRIDSYEDHNYHIENENLFFTRTRPYSIPNPIRSAPMGRWVWGGDRMFVKKRYGKTRVGGFLFSVRVELPFFYTLCFLMEYGFFHPKKYCKKYLIVYALTETEDHINSFQVEVHSPCHLRTSENL